MPEWTPILSSSSRLTERAFEAIHAIGGELVTTGRSPSWDRVRGYRDYETALLFAYFEAIGGSERYWFHCAERLKFAINKPSARQSSALYGGLAGLGWTLAHLSQLEGLDHAPASCSAWLTGDQVRGLLDTIDAELVSRLHRGSSMWHYDLINGLVGIGIYFLERLPGGAAEEGLRLVVDHLHAQAEHGVHGIAWSFRKHRAEDQYNLGVAHGVPGIIHLLSEAAAAGVNRERASFLLTGAVRWLFAHQRPEGSRSRFSSWITGAQQSESRLAWCYGDLGILAVLFQAARRANRHEWRQLAEELLDHCLAWPMDTTRVEDACLCHGAVGVAHIYNRLYQSEGDTRCREAAVLWYERALAMRQNRTGFGGFVELTRHEGDKSLVFLPSAGLLGGGVGIALALLAATTSVAPRWDRILLLSARD